MKRSCVPFYVIFVLTLLVLVVIDGASMAYYFSRPAQVRSFLSSKIGDTFEIGDSNVRFDNGIVLSDVSLFTDRESNPFLKTNQIRIQFNPLHVLAGDFVPTEISIYSPELTLKKTKNNQINVQEFLNNLPEREAQEVSPQKQVPSKQQQIKTNISIIDGNLTLTNFPSLLRDGKELKLHGCDIDVRSIRNQRGLLFDGGGDGTLGRLNFSGRFYDGALSARATARSIMVNEELIDTFSSEVREVWSKYNATGPANISYELELDLNSGVEEIPPEAHRLTVRPQGMNGAFADFPYPMKNLQGMMEFTSEGLTFELRSTINKAEFSINGHTEGYGERSKLNVGIHAENVPIDRDLYTALEQMPDVLDIVQSLNASGTVNATGYINRQEGREDVDFLIRLFPRDLQVRYDEFPYPFKNVRGTVIIEPDQVRLENIQASPAASTGSTVTSPTELNGSILFADEENESASYNLRINSSNIPLDSTLKTNLPEEVQVIWSRLQPAGSASANWTINKSIAAEEPRHEIDVTLQNCSLTPSEYDQTVEGVSGNISYRNERISITDVSGRWNNGTIQIKNGEVQTTEKSPFATFTLGASNVQMNSSLKQVVFNGGELPEAIKNKGTVDVNGSVKWYQQENAEIEYFLTLNVNDVGFKKVVDLDEIQGKIVLKGEHRNTPDQSQPSLTGGVDLSEITVNGVPITSVQSNFLLRDNRIELHELNGEVLDGNLKNTKILLNTLENTFNVSLETTGLSFQKSLVSLGVDERNLSGTLSGNGQLSGSFEDRSTWTGNAQLQLRDAQLWRLPLFLPIFMELRLPKQKPFNEGKINLEVKNESVLVRQMLFESSSSRLSGTGHVGFDGRLLIYLKTRELNPVIPPIPIVGWLYNQVTSNLLTFQATGTLMNPSVSATPLPFLFQRRFE